MISLTADTSLFIAAPQAAVPGNDTTGTGSASAPFATIKRALAYAYANLDLCGYTLTFQLAVAPSGQWIYDGGNAIAGKFRGQTNPVRLDGRPRYIGGDLWPRQRPAIDEE